MNTGTAAAAHGHAELAALSRAGGALWLATLSLMTVFMQTAAPAHRYLLAARIARNFSVLREQECFGERTRATFARMAVRWRNKAEELSPSGRMPQGALAWLQRLLAR